MKQTIKILRNVFDTTILAYCLIGIFRTIFSIKMHYIYDFQTSTMSSSVFFNNTAIYYVSSMHKIYNYIDYWQIYIEIAIILIAVFATVFITLKKDNKNN